MRAMLAVGAALCCLAIGWPSAAGLMRPSFFDGAKLDKACSSQEVALDVGVCFGYVLGVADIGEGIQSLRGEEERLWCWSDDISVTVAMERAVDAVKAYLRKYPEAQKWSGSAVVWEALKENLPCK